MKNKDLILMRIIDITFWSILLIISTKNIISQVDIDYEILSKLPIIYIIRVIFMLLEKIIIQIIIYLIAYFPITFIYLLFKIGLSNKKIVKGKLDSIDFKNNNYYRDILPKYSPGVLSYIDNFKLSKNDLVATILELELKGRIKIGQEIEIKDESCESLSKNEKFIIENLKIKSIKEIDIKEYENVVIEDCKNSQLIQEKTYNLKKIESLGKIIAAILLLSIIITLFLPIFIIIFEYIIVPIFFVFLPFYLIAEAILFENGNKQIYIRTKEGKEINEKIEGLRKYLLNYSKMEAKTKEEIALWEEYLIYAVIFDINKNIVNEIYEKR